MKILLTNDDGIYAKGLLALYNELSRDFDVDIVAPESEMSAVGHAITLSSPLRVRKVYRNDSFFGYGVTGTPADCVKIAVQELLDTRPDIIISGINRGANVGVNVLYSGTVSAATEGAFFGIKSAAISLSLCQDPDYNFAARFSRVVISYMDQNNLRKGVALNVNIPALSAERIRGVALTRQGLGRFKESFERRVDPRGNVYYWLLGETPLEENAPDTDANALKNDMITITPVSYDLTSKEELNRLRTFPCNLSDFVRQAADESQIQSDFEDLEIK